MASEELVADIFQKVLEITEDSVATACLFRLTDRGVYTIRELPDVARHLKRKFGGSLEGVVEHTVNSFAIAAQIEGGR